VGLFVGARRPFPFLDASRRRGAFPLAPGNQNAAGRVRVPRMVKNSVLGRYSSGLRAGKSTVFLPNFQKKSIFSLSSKNRINNLFNFFKSCILAVSKAVLIQ